MEQPRYTRHLGNFVTLRYVMSLTCCSTTWCSFGTEVILGDVVTLRYVMSLTCCTATWCSLGTEVIWGTSLHWDMSCHLPAVRPHGAASVQRSSGELRYTEICHVTNLLYVHMVQSRYRGHLGDVVTLRYVMSLTCCTSTWCSLGREVIWGRRYTEICHVTYLLYGHIVQPRYRGHLGDVVTLRFVMSLTCCTATWCSLGTGVIWGTSLHWDMSCH